MAGYNKRFTYSAIGTNDVSNDFGSDDVSYAVSDNGSNSSVSTVEVKIGDGWYTDDNFAIGDPMTFDGPINGLRLVTTSMGTATAIYLDVTARGRYG